MAERLLQLENEHYDINYAVRQKDFEINELTISVNDLRGKFVKPTLKKVSKTDTRFSKLKKKDQKNFIDFRTNLKNVENNKFTLKEPYPTDSLSFNLLGVLRPKHVSCNHIFEFIKNEVQLGYDQIIQCMKLEVSEK
ncbi:troponin I [Loa loa]|uniref:Troponin I n=1 Tax=Loa loa TaxID=7209 RepID=A0A1S0TNI7_LOALO|nr:troponin I [Loa loa]EFO16679.2 troponin I [Loa loa]